MKDENLTEKQAAEYLGMSDRFVRKARAVLGLPYYKIGRSVRIKRKDLIQWEKMRRAS